MAQDLIVKHNKVIESKYHMTSTEAKIIAKLTCMINKDDEDFKEHIFRSSDLLEELGFGVNNYVALEEAISKLITREIKIQQSNDKKLVTTFLSSCLYDNTNSTVILSYDPKLKPYFLQLKKNFTKYNLENILELKSFYAIRIYELVKQYERIKERTIELEELKDILDATQKSYNRYNNFKRKVLLQAQDEINEKTDLEIDFEEIKTGRKVTAIKFLIKKKEKVKEEIADKKADRVKEYSLEVIALFKLLPPKEQIERYKIELERLLKEHSYDYLKSDIEYAKRFEVNNFFGFLKSSCERGHYSAAELEKEEKEQELAKQRTEEKRKKKELKEKIQKKAQEKAIEKYDKLSAQEIESHNSTYQKLPKMLKDKISKQEFIIGALEEEIEKELKELSEMVL